MIPFALTFIKLFFTSLPPFSRRETMPSTELSLHASVISLGGPRFLSANETLTALGFLVDRVEPPAMDSAAVQREMSRARSDEPDARMAVSLMLAHKELWDCHSDWRVIFEDDVAPTAAPLDSTEVRSLLRHVATHASHAPMVMLGRIEEAIRVRRPDRGRRSLNLCPSADLPCVELDSCGSLGLHAYAVRCRLTRGLFRRARASLPRRLLRYPSHARFNADVLLRDHFTRERRGARWPLCVAPVAFRQATERFASMLNHSRKSF